MIKMTKIVFSKIYASLFDFILTTNSELIIICPFIKKNALEKVLAQLSSDVKVVVVVRWKLEDLISGSSDLEIYPIIRKLNHKLYLHHNIHLKIFLKDKKEIFLGSANITNSGLGLDANSNIEAISVNDSDQNAIFEISKILKSSKIVNEDLFNTISEIVVKFENSKINLKSEREDMEKQDEKIFEKNITNLVVVDFPFCDSPQTFIRNYFDPDLYSAEMAHDIKLFGVSKEESKNTLTVKLKKEFLSSSAFTWQNSIVGDGVSFGRYSSLLHDALTDDPKPYRKKIKELVNNMINWTLFFTNEYKIDKYAHTIVLNRVKSL